MAPDSAAARPGRRGVILAGGRSSRMGRDKALVELRGRPLVMVAADALRGADVSAVVVVGGDAAAISLLGLAVEPDRWPGEGPLGGLLTGLGTASHPEDVVVVLTCDLVALEPAVVRMLLHAIDHHPDADAAAPSADGHRQMLVAAYRAGCAPALQARFDAGERSVRRAVERSGLDVVDVPDVASGLLADADRPEDLPG